MKKAILSILLLGMSCTLMAREPDETELKLEEKVEWCQAQGQKLYTQAFQDGVCNSACLDGALKFFKLEREYIEELRWNNLFGALLEEFEDDWDWDDEDDEDYDPRFKRTQILKQLKRSK